MCHDFPAQLQTDAKLPINNHRKWKAVLCPAPWPLLGTEAEKGSGFVNRCSAERSSPSWGAHFPQTADCRTPRALGCRRPVGSWTPLPETARKLPAHLTVCTTQSDWCYSATVTVSLWFWQVSQVQRADNVHKTQPYVLNLILKDSFASFFFWTPPSSTLWAEIYMVCIGELWSLQWKLLMRALTAVLLQIQEAHLATQHGEPVRGGTGSCGPVSKFHCNT